MAARIGSIGGGGWEAGLGDEIGRNGVGRVGGGYGGGGGRTSCVRREVGAGGYISVFRLVFGSGFFGQPHG